MRSKRMKPVAKHADQLQQQAVQVYIVAQQEVIDAQKQLEQLIGYRAEYDTSRTNSGFNATQLRDFLLFMDKLSLSIEQAKQIIEQRKHECEQQKINWLKHRSRSKALDAVICKYQVQEAQIEARIEQKEQDEYASRAAARKDSHRS